MHYRLLVFAALATWFVGCAGIGPAREPTGVLRLLGEPRDARIIIDDVTLGPLHVFERDGVLLRPGEHRVIARRAGYFPEYTTVTIEAQQVTTMTIKLRKIPE